MQILTQSLLAAARKSARGLQRDFFELEMLQTSVRSTDNFCNNSVSRTKKNLHKELENHSYPIFDINDTLPEDCSEAIIIDVIDSMENFGKSLPFFATIIFYIKKINEKWEVLNLVIDLPALAKTCYTEKKLGVWLDQYSHNDIYKTFRLKVSGCKSFEKVIIGTNNNDFIVSGALESKRNFGSIYYMLVLFAGGKFDGVYMSDMSPLMQLSCELLVKEAGGACAIQDNDFIATNITLIEEFKKLII